MGKHFGNVDEYATALGNVIPHATGKQIDILRAHCEAPRRTETAQELALAVGYANFKGANGQYGGFAHRMAVELGILERPRGFWLYILVDFAGDVDSKGHARFILRKPVVEALGQLGYPWARLSESSC